MPSYHEPSRPYSTLDFQLSEMFPGRLWLGEAPRAQDMPVLRRLGITDIVNLTSIAEVHALEREAEFTVHHYPFPDGFFASRGDGELRDHAHRMMEEAATRLDELLGAGKPTYLHCVAGISRSPTVLILWMLRSGQAPTFREALDRAARVRPVVSPNPDLVDIVRELHPGAFPPQ